MSGHERDVSHFLVFGEHLLSISRDEKVLKMWHIKTSEYHDQVNFDSYLNVSCIIHPDTYVNKVLIGTEEGILELWNIKSKKRIYRYEGWGAGVTSIAQSPAVDIVAIGLTDGRIILHNLKSDKTLFEFIQVEGAVTSLAFRTDGVPQLVSGSMVGTLAVWDLEKRKLGTLMRNVHDGAVVSMSFFANEPILLTSGTDNSLKIWIFDMSDGTARILRSRCGHSSPPTKIRFFNTSSTILSSGRDRSLRYFSTVRDQRSTEFSQGNFESLSKKMNHIKSPIDLKLPPISSFDASIAKQRDWDCIISCHRNTNVATTWNKEKMAIGKHSLRSSERKARPITSVCISSCGNFAIIGSASGWIDKYNIQSSIHRGTFPGKMRKRQNKMKETKSSHIANPDEASPTRHTDAIQGLCVDAFNRYLVSGSLDGHLKFWDFKSGQLVKDVDIESPITQIEISKENSLIAVVSDDLTVHIFDVNTQVCIRRFSGHSSFITDLSFSGDSKWIATASSDGTIRLWDLPTGQCIDWIKMESPVVSISFSPRGDFLATSHVDYRGIYIWSNQNYFADVFIKPYTLSYPTKVEMPRVDGSFSVNESISTDDFDLSKEHDLNNDDILSEELISLSRTPRSKWKTLVNLDDFKDKNKADKELEIPKNAPFLLPTLSGVDPKFIAVQEEEIGDAGNKLINLSKFNIKTKLILALEATENHPTEEKYDEVLSLVKEFSPSAIDFEIRSLSVTHHFREFKLFLRFIQYLMNKKYNYEIAEALLNVFLKVHASILFEAIEGDKELEQIFGSLADKQSGNWERLEGLFDNTLCLLMYFNNLQ